MRDTTRVEPRTRRSACTAVDAALPPAMCHVGMNVRALTTQTSHDSVKNRFVWVNPYWLELPFAEAAEKLADQDRGDGRHQGNREQIQLTL